MPRIGPLRNYPWITLTSIPMKTKEKQHVICSFRSRMKHVVDLQVLKPLSHIVLKDFQPRNVHLIENTHLQALEHIT